MEYVKPQYDEPKRGEIYYITPSENTESVGSEQCNHDRPAIIVSNNTGNKFSPVVEVVYLTTKPKRNLPTHVDIYTTTKPSTALCEQICTVSKLRLRKYINECTEQEMNDIDMALLISLGISSTKGTTKYMEKWFKLTQEYEDTKDELTEIKKEEPNVQEPTSTDLQIELEKTRLELELYKKFYNDTYSLLEHSVSR